MSTNNRKSLSRLIPSGKSQQLTSAKKAQRIYKYRDVVLERLIKRHKELSEINDQLTAVLRQLIEEDGIEE